MRSIRCTFKNWHRKKNFEGLVMLLSASTDPLATLRLYRRSINDNAIEDLLNFSLFIAKTKGLETGLKWVAIAYQACLIEGNAKSLADCLYARAELLFELYQERQGKENKISRDQVAAEHSRSSQ